MDSVDQTIRKWFGHIERIGEESLTKRVYGAGVNRVRGRSRPNKLNNLLSRGA